MENIENDKENKEDGLCIVCSGQATKANNTLCQLCWNDAEGFDPSEI